MRHKAGKRNKFEKVKLNLLIDEGTSIVNRSKAVTTTKKKEPPRRSLIVSGPCENVKRDAKNSSSPHNCSPPPLPPCGKSSVDYPMLGRSLPPPPPLPISRNLAFKKSSKKTKWITWGGK